MSKRWKVRKRNAAKLERSREVMARFHESVDRCIKEMVASEQEILKRHGITDGQVIRYP